MFEPTLGLLWGIHAIRSHIIINVILLAALDASAAAGLKLTPIRHSFGQVFLQGGPPPRSTPSSAPQCPLPIDMLLNIGEPIVVDDSQQAEDEANSQVEAQARDSNPQWQPEEADKSVAHDHDGWQIFDPAAATDVAGSKEEWETFEPETLVDVDVENESTQIAPSSSGTGDDKLATAGQPTAGFSHRDLTRVLNLKRSASELGLDPKVIVGDIMAGKAKPPSRCAVKSRPPVKRAKSTLTLGESDSPF